MARRRGINPKALERIRAEMRAPEEVSSPFSRTVEGMRNQRQAAFNQGVAEVSGDEEGADGWSQPTLTPNSTRVASFRYNFPSMELEVDWTNGTNNGFTYSGVPESVYRDFIATGSKGKFVNNVLNDYLNT